MFCKFCGKEITAETAFCPECGKKLKKEETREKEARRSVSAPLVLMILLLCGSTVYSWLRVLLFKDQVSVGFLVESLMLVAGLIILAVCISKEKIDPTKYRFSDVLVLVCLWGPLFTLVLLKESEIVQNFGSYALAAFWGVNSLMEPLLQFPGFWVALGLVLLGLGRRGEWKPSKKQWLILLAVLLVRSTAALIFDRPMMSTLEVPAEIVAYLYDFGGPYLVLCWLWPLVILNVFWKLGRGKIGAPGAAAAFVGMRLGEFLLLPIFLAILHFGMAGYGIAKGISPLFGLVILCIAARLHKKKSEVVN